MENNIIIEDVIILKRIDLIEDAINKKFKDINIFDFYKNTKYYDNGKFKSNIILFLDNDNELKILINRYKFKIYGK